MIYEEVVDAGRIIDRGEEFALPPEFEQPKYRKTNSPPPLFSNISCTSTIQSTLTFFFIILIPSSTSSLPLFQ
jgi:hypothetical protein